MKNGHDLRQTPTCSGTVEDQQKNLTILEDDPRRDNSRWQHAISETFQRLNQFWDILSPEGKTYLKLGSGFQTHSLVIGINRTMVSSQSGTKVKDTLGLDMTYLHRFYSLLGLKLRLYGFSRLELNKSVRSLTPGLGFEFNPQKLWMPALYLQGGGILGDITADPEQTYFGAGITGSAGMRFNIEYFGVVGIEYNVIKDMVNKDAVLHRLMISAGLRIF